MASLVLKMSVSLDGYVAPVDGSTDWIAAAGSDDALSWTVETVSNAGAHLMGAATYAGWAGYWPGASGPFAKPMNEIPRWWCSRTCVGRSSPGPSANYSILTRPGSSASVGEVSSLANTENGTPVKMPHGCVARWFRSVNPL